MQVQPTAVRSGRRSRSAGAKYLMEDLEIRTLLSALPPVTPESPVHGMGFAYYEGTYSAVPNFASLTAVKKGLADNFDLSIRNRDSYYAFNYTGYVDVPLTGQYYFFTNSDDGSKMWIDGQLVVNNDGLHAPQEQWGGIELQAGYHSIQVGFIQGQYGHVLEVKYQPPYQSKVTIPVDRLYATKPADVNVASYGAVGDGSTNDTAAIQAAINAAPDRATLVLGTNKTYKLNSGLVLSRPLNIQGNGSTFKLNTSAYPQNETLYYESPMSATAYTWSQTVTSGQTSFNVAVSPDTIKPGDTIYLELGQDPNDPSQPNWGELVKVTANTGTSITIDTPVPFNINSGSLANKLRRVTDVVSGVSLKNFNFDWFNGTTPDTNIWLTAVRDTTIESVGGRFTIMANVTHSRNVTIKNVSGDLVKLVSSGGRGITAWQTDGLNVQNATFNTNYDAPAVFLESWSRNTTIDGITVNWNYSGVSNQDVFHFTGNSYNTYVTNALINNVGAINLVQSGSQPAAYSFGTVRVNGTIKSAPLTKIASLVTPTKTYNASNTTTSTFTINIGSNWMDYQALLCSGVVRSMTFTLSNTTGVNAIFLTNSSGGGMNLIGQLVAGVPKVMDQFFGTDNAFNDPSSPEKKFHFYTGSVPAGTTLQVSVTYYNDQSTPSALVAKASSIQWRSIPPLTTFIMK